MNEIIRYRVQYGSGNEVSFHEEQYKLADALASRFNGVVFADTYEYADTELVQDYTEKEEEEDPI